MFVLCWSVLNSSFIYHRCPWVVIPKVPKVCKHLPKLCVTIYWGKKLLKTRGKSCCSIFFLFGKYKPCVMGFRASSHMLWWLNSLIYWEQVLMDGISYKIKLLLLWYTDWGSLFSSIAWESSWCELSFKGLLYAVCEVTLKCQGDFYTSPSAVLSQQQICSM